MKYIIFSVLEKIYLTHCSHGMSAFKLQCRENFFANDRKYKLYVE